MGRRRKRLCQGETGTWLPVIGAAAFSLLLAACDNGGQSPTAPSPAQPAQVAGRWTGSASAAARDLRGGGCPGDALRQTAESVAFDLVFTIQQNGANLTGQFVNTDGDISCRFTGTVRGNTVDGALTNCTDPPVDLGWIPGCGSGPWTLETTAGAISATVSGSSMTGTLTDTYALRSGSQRHTASLAGRFTARK